MQSKYLTFLLPFASIALANPAAILSKRQGLSDDYMKCITETCGPMTDALTKCNVQMESFAGGMPDDKTASCLCSTPGFLDAMAPCMKCTQEQGGSGGLSEDLMDQAVKAWEGLCNGSGGGSGNSGDELPDSDNDSGAGSNGNSGSDSGSDDGGNSSSNDDDTPTSSNVRPTPSSTRTGAGSRTTDPDSSDSDSDSNGSGSGRNTNSNNNNGVLESDGAASGLTASIATLAGGLLVAALLA